MWLIVCSIEREYSVVSEKDVLSGNVTCGSRVTIAEKGLKKEVTIIFTHKTRAQCDQYCQRLSRYCSPTEGQRAPIDITFLNLPRKKNDRVDEELSESSSTHAESLFDKGHVKEEPTENVSMEVNQEEVTMEANLEEVKPPSITAAEILMEHHEPAPSTSSEQDDDEENGGTYLSCIYILLLCLFTFLVPPFIPYAHFLDFKIPITGTFSGFQNTDNFQKKKLCQCHF